MSFLLAIFAGMMTYIYMQWPVIIGLFTPIALLLLAIAVIQMLLFLSNDSEQARSKEKERVQLEDPKADVGAAMSAWSERLKQVHGRAKRFFTAAIVVFFLGFLAPNQKVLGTVVAVGATTYFAHEVVTSDVVQTFLNMVKGEAMIFMTERMEASTKVVAETAVKAGTAASK